MKIVKKKQWRRVSTGFTFIFYSLILSCFCRLIVKGYTLKHLNNKYDVTKRDCRGCVEFVLSETQLCSAESRNLCSPNRLWKMNPTEVFHFTRCLKTLGLPLIENNLYWRVYGITENKFLTETNAEMASIKMWEMGLLEEFSDLWMKKALIYWILFAKAEKYCIKPYQYPRKNIVWFELSNQICIIH